MVTWYQRLITKLCTTIDHPVESTPSTNENSQKLSDPNGDIMNYTIVNDGDDKHEHIFECNQGIQTSSITHGAFT